MAVTRHCACRWFALLLMGGGSARALPTQTFQVSASIVNGCVISGTNIGVLGTLNFGTLPGVGSSTAYASFVQNSSIVLSCTPGTTLDMSIDGGSNFSSASRNLKVTGNTNLVPYSLFSDTSYTTSIPVNQNITVSYSNANNIVLPIYGRLSISGSNLAGTYTDTLTVTLSW